jgi:hypothetical protein
VVEEEREGMRKNEKWEGGKGGRTEGAGKSWE